MKLNIDIETRSGVDVKTGVYRYAADDDFQVLWFGYSINDGPVEIIDTSEWVDHEEWPKWIRDAMFDPKVEKHAFNAQFERVCLSAAMGLDVWKGKYLDPAQWHCTMVQAAEHGYGGKLENVADALELPVRKGAEGTRLINFFSKPKKDGTFNQPEDDPERWERFGEYNRQDVVVELAINKTFGPISPGERRLYITDQIINDRGVMLDTEMVDGAVALADEAIADGFDRIRELTGVANPNSNKQIIEWLATQGVKTDSLAKGVVDEIIETKPLTREAKRYFRLRKATALASVKKYRAAQNGVSEDGRLRGQFMFHGAHTGRWTGRILQPQNLPQGGKLDPEVYRPLVRNQDRAAILERKVSTANVLKDVIRTVMIPKPDHKFIIFDYSAIEAVVLAWQAGEDRVLDVFRTHGKLYESNAAAMFKLDFDDIGNPSPERDKGKIATLACGYQGSVGAMSKMGGEKMGLSEDAMLGVVRDYRRVHPKTVQWWWDMESAFKGVVGGRWQRLGPLKFRGEDGGVTIQLPSKRKIFYPQVSLDWQERNGNRRLVPSFLGKDQKTGRLTRIETYGGKLTENCTQAIARDILALAIMRLEKAGFPVVLHVHDEVVVEVPEAVTVAEVGAIVEKLPKWAADMPLKASGFESLFYKKD